jgi:hypothetical protein
VRGLSLGAVVECMNMFRSRQGQFSRARLELSSHCLEWGKSCRDIESPHLSCSLLYLMFVDSAEERWLPASRIRVVNILFQDPGLDGRGGGWRRRYRAGQAFERQIGCFSVVDNPETRAPIFCPRSAEA